MCSTLPGASPDRLRHNGQPYRGINVLMLWGDSVDKGFVSPFWLTYKQAAEMKAQVRKGQHGSTVVYADRLTQTGTDDKGQEVEEQIPFLKAYTVFNAEQVEGLPAHFYAQPADPLPLSERIASADAFVATTRAELHHGGNMAYYAPGRIGSSCRLSRPSGMRRATTPRCCTS